MLDGPLYNTLDIKEAAILHKYTSAMGRQIAKGDAETKATVSPQLLVKLQASMVKFYGNAVVLKSCMVQTPVL